MHFTDYIITTCGNLTLKYVQTVPGTARVQLRTGRSLSHMYNRHKHMVQQSGHVVMVMGAGVPPDSEGLG